MNNMNEELYLAVYKVSVSCTLYGKEHKLETELVAESHLEALESVRDFLVELGAEQFSCVCRQLYCLMWAFVTV